MPTELSYEQAFDQLEQLADALQNESLPMNEVETRLKEANELITYCRDKLRSTERSVEGLFAQE